MNNMRIPTRPAPTVQEARSKNTEKDRYKINLLNEKKQPPPRPPPPNFNKAKSKSAWNLDLVDNTVSLIEWSPPNSPKSTKHPFAGSISSSFSSSTSSLASSKKSLEYETVPFSNPWNNNSPFPFPSLGLQASNIQQQNTRPVPTIIRGVPSKKSRTVNQYISRDLSPRAMSPLSNGSQEQPCLLDLNDFSSPRMPSGPPPSPPKDVVETIEPFGIALFEYPASQSDDLQLQPNDIVFLIKKLNEEWYYGRVDDREGMFPANFIDIHVPLPKSTGNTATALYEFRPQLPGDLELKPGQKVKVINRISESWIYGESEGRRGQFPSNFIDLIPPHI